MGPGLTRETLEKSSQNSPILLLIFSGSMPWAFHVYIYICLKVVSHYDLSGLSTSVMGFQQWGWVVVLSNFILNILNFLTLKRPLTASR